MTNQETAQAASPGGPFGAPGAGPPPGGFGAPQGGGWGPPPGPGGFGGFPGGGYGQPVPAPSDRLNTTLPVVLGLFASVCACLPGGMAAIALAMMAKDQERRGDVQGARSKMTYSYVVSIGSILIGVPLVILYVILEFTMRY